MTDLAQQNQQLIEEVGSAEEESAKESEAEKRASSEVVREADSKMVKDESVSKEEPASVKSGPAQQKEPEAELEENNEDTQQKISKDDQQQVVEADPAVPDNQPSKTESTYTPPTEIPDRSELLTHQGRTKRLNQAKANFRDRMKYLYGSYYEAMFEPGGVSIGQHWMHKSPSQYSDHTGTQAPRDTNKSWNGLVRKLHIKLLQVQLGILNEKQGGEKKAYYAQYLWMTGGDM